MRVIIFVDYDNLLPPRRSAGLLDVTTSALMAYPLDTTETRGRCEVRVYAGWYEGQNLTQHAQDVSSAIRDEFPTILRIPTQTGGSCRMAVRAELAFSMSEEPTRHLFDTYRKKQIPANFKPVNPVTAGCTVSSCVLSCLPQLFKKKRCPEPSCSIGLADLMVRNEQKLVDTMLTCDIIHATGQDYQRIIIVSGDDDLLPAARTALLRGVPVVRLHSRPTYQAADFPEGSVVFFEDSL